MATEARPNPVILEDDNEGSTSREIAGQYSLCNIQTYMFYGISIRIWFWK